MSRWDEVTELQVTIMSSKVKNVSILHQVPSITEDVTVEANVYSDLLHLASLSPTTILIYCQIFYL